MLVLLWVLEINLWSNWGSFEERFDTNVTCCGVDADDATFAEEINWG
jgi:hypothetical protein